MSRWTTVTRALVKREVKSFFGNPAGYVFIAIFVLVAAWFLFSDEFFQNNVAGLETLNEAFPYLLIFFIPAITMGIWAGEKGQGTDELLLTLPASDAQIVLGKYLAAASVYSLTLLFTIPQLIVLWILGNPDFTLILGNYVGYWLLGLTMLGAGMVGSQLSDNLTVAFILGALMCALVVLAETVAGAVFPALMRTWLIYFPIALFHEVGTGVISLATLALFGGLIGAFLYLNLLLISRRHWRNTEGWHGAVRLASIGAGVLGLTLSVGALNARLDTTSERIHSLSDETRALISRLDPDRPVNIEAYVSPEVPREYVQTRHDLLNLLRQYDAMGGDAVRVRVVDTERYSDEARQAKEKFGIEAEELWVEEEGGRRRHHVYLGIAVTCGLEETVIPFLYSKLPVEYELTRSIRTVSQAERRRLGILKTDVDLFGGFDPATMRTRPEWEIVKELELQYEVVGVNPDEDYPDDLDVLLAPMASSLTQEQLDRLAAHVKGGGPTLLIDDPMPLAAPGTGPSDPKGGRNNRGPFGGGSAPTATKGDFVSFLADINIDWAPGDVAWDTYNPHPEIEEGLDPEIVFVGHRSGADQPFNPNESITAGLQEVVTMFGGVVKPGNVEGMEFIPLLQSSKLSGVVLASEVMTRDFFGSRINPRRRHWRRPEQYLACRVTGRPSEDASDVNVVFVPDLDLVSEQFFELRRRRVPGLSLDFDNVTFVLNCVDALSGDESVIALRKRRPRHRTLVTIEAKTEEFQRDWLREKELAEQEAREALAAAQARLDDAVKRVRESTDLDETSKQIRIESIREVEQRRLEVAKAKIEDAKQGAIEEARARRIEGQRSIRGGFQLTGRMISPLAAVGVGLVVFFSRLKGDRLNVRRVAGAGESS